MARSKPPKPIHQLSAAQFEAMFPDEEACKVYLAARRWPNGVYCARAAAARTSMNSRPWRSVCQQRSEFGLKPAV